MGVIRSLLGVVVIVLAVSLAFFGRDWSAQTPVAGIVYSAPAPARSPQPQIAAEPVGLVRAVPSTPFDPISVADADAESVTAIAATPAAAPAATVDAPHLVVAADAVNMRSGPNSGSAVMRSYPRGTALVELERSASWVRVSTPDGTTGWMFGRYLEAAAPAAAPGPG